MTLSDADAANEALEISRWAKEENFESHRGVGQFENIEAVYVWDNHPYGNDRALRPREHATLVAALARVGIRGTVRSWPVEGEYAGYTVAIVFDVSRFCTGARSLDDAERAVRVEWDRILQAHDPIPAPQAFDELERELDPGEGGNPQ